jgi:hypothetical protein
MLWKPAGHTREMLFSNQNISVFFDYMWHEASSFSAEVCNVCNFGTHSVDSGWGRAIAHAVSCWLPTAAARVRSRVWSSGICGGQSGAEAGFPWQSTFHQLLHNHPHLSSGAGTIGQKWLQYKGLSRTPLAIKEIHTMQVFQILVTQNNNVLFHTWTRIYFLHNTELYSLHFCPFLRVMCKPTNSHNRTAAIWHIRI